MVLMNKKSRIFAVTAAVLCLSVIACGLWFYKERTERFASSEKMTVAMGTIVTQKVYSEYAGKDIEKINGIINALDDKISWRNSSSDIAKLNSEKNLNDAAIASYILKCNEVSESCGGVFDITVGEISKLWGIGETTQKVPEKSEIEFLLKDVGYENTEIKGNDITLKTDCSVDLGAVGKGIACDMAKSYLEASDANGAVISVGGSILAWGSYNKAGDPWKVAVRHPHKENEYIGVITLNEGFVSTSGDYERFFEQDGKRYHHILDAKSGYPAESGLASVSVVCSSGILSDALSTACFILGEEKSRPVLEKYGAGAVFIYSDLKISTVGDVSFEG